MIVQWLRFTRQKSSEPSTEFHCHLRESQAENLARIAPVHQKIPTSHMDLRNEGVHNVKKPHKQLVLANVLKTM